MKKLIIFLILATHCFAGHKLPDKVRDFSRRIVWIQANSQKYTYTGTGWWVNSSTICTARHVIEGTDYDDIYIEFPERGVKAEVVAEDKTYDIALLRPKNGSRFDSAKFDTDPDYLDPAFICGYAAALEDSDGNPVMALAESQIAAKGVSSELCPLGIVLGTTVFPGTSGSPVVTPDGRVLGIILGTQDDESQEWFATISPASNIQKLLTE